MHDRPVPPAGRPKMPAGYQISKSADGQMAWSDVEARLVASRNYWIATSRPDGRPHVMPVWGVWLDGVLLFSTARESRKGRNLAANPAVVVHLESGDNAVIVEGTAAEARDSAELARFDDAYHRKYGMRILGFPGDNMHAVVTPRVVFAWREKDFPKSATRWLFG